MRTKEQFAISMAGTVIKTFIEENDITEENIDDYSDNFDEIAREAIEMYLSESSDDSLYHIYNLDKLI